MQERNRAGNSYTNDMWLNPDVQYNTGNASVAYVTGTHFESACLSTKVLAVKKTA